MRNHITLIEGRPGAEDREVEIEFLGGEIEPYLVACCERPELSYEGLGKLCWIWWLNGCFIGPGEDITFLVALEKIAKEVASGSRTISDRSAALSNVASIDPTLQKTIEEIADAYGSDGLSVEAAESILVWLEENAELWRDRK